MLTVTVIAHVDGHRIRCAAAVVFRYDAVRILRYFRNQGLRPRRVNLVTANFPGRRSFDYLILARSVGSRHLIPAVCEGNALLLNRSVVVVCGKQVFIERVVTKHGLGSRAAVRSRRTAALRIDLARQAERLGVRYIRARRGHVHGRYVPAAVLHIALERHLAAVRAYELCSRERAVAVIGIHLAHAVCVRLFQRIAVIVGDGQRLAARFELVAFCVVQRFILIRTDGHIGVCVYAVRRYGYVLPCAALMIGRYGFDDIALLARRTVKIAQYRGAVAHY